MNVVKPNKVNPTIMSQYNITNKKRTSDNISNEQDIVNEAVTTENNSNKKSGVILTINHEDSNKNLQEGVNFVNNSSKSSNDVPTQLLRRSLEFLIKKVGMLNRMTYDVKSWNGLMKSMGKAQTIAINDNASVADLRKALETLRSGLNGLKAAEREKEKEGIRNNLPLALKLANNSTGTYASSIPSGGSCASVTVATPSINVSV